MQVPDKKTLRSQLLAQRTALTVQEVQTQSAGICKRLLERHLPSGVRRVLLYLPIRKEVDTWMLCHHFWDNSIAVLLPRCHPTEPGHMDIYSVSGIGDIAPGRYAIMEPVPTKATLQPDPQPDLIVVPALAYDERGYRLGYGGGYYDRFLSSGSGPLSIGLAYDFQILPQLPVDSWDCPVDLVVTPSRTIIIRKELS